MKKAFLEKKLARLNEKRSAIMARCASSEDVNEIRNLTSQIEDVNAEIDEVKEEIAICEHDEACEEARSAMPDKAELRNGDVVATFKKSEEKRSENVTASMEYRSAFMAYVQKGTPMPAEVRNGEVISTNETGVAIPETVMNEVINTVKKRYGNLYSKVRKTNVAGGVKIPIGSLSASFKWISESTVSPRQKTDKLGAITFGYNVAEIRVAQTFLSQILTLSSFEAELSRVIAIAYLQAMDDGIVNGSGDGAMLGILNDARVTNVIQMSASDMGDWTKWRKNFFAKLPLGYRSGDFIFPLSTVESYFETMADSNNNPIYRQATGLEINDGDATNPNGRFFGREIEVVEPDIIPDFDTANVGDVIGVYWQPNEYAINENFGFTMRRYFDEETNEWVDKALVVVDGKILNPNGFYLIKKKA